MKPWIEKGKLPTIEQIIKNGVSGDLQSIVPPLTPPAWTSFMTGKYPGKHGTFDFVKRKKDTTEQILVNSGDIGTKCIWDFLSERGKKSIVINVPNTYPTWKIEGIMISGHGCASKENCSYPKHIITEIEESIGEYIIFPDKMSKVNNILKTIEKRKQAVLYLMKNYEYDFFMVEFQMTDAIFHVTVDERKIIEVYQKVDESIAEIIHNIDFLQTNLIIVSDHGMGASKKVINFNKWLNELGLYATKIDSKGDSPSLTKLLKEKTNENTTSSYEIIYNLLAKLGLTQDNVYYWLCKLRLKFLKEFIPRSITSSAPRVVIDWHKTKVYRLATAGINLGFLINLKGREPLGTVEPGREYEELRNQVIKELYNLREPETDEKVIERVFKREEIYTGSYLNKAPDIIFIPKNYNYISTTGVDTAGVLMEKPDEMSYHSHKMNGILIANGPDIKQSTRINGAEIIDLAPTILYMMGIPIPEDMDGRVLKEIFKEDSEFAKGEVIYQKINEKERIKERIRVLKALNRE